MNSELESGKKKQAPGPARVFIVDDHPFVRYAICRLVGVEKNLTVCGEAESQRQAMEAMEIAKPDVAVIDIVLKDGNGIGLVKDIRARGWKFPVVVLSAFDDDIYVHRAFKAGSQGYVTKDDVPHILVAAIREVLAGEIYVCESMARKLLIGNSAWHLAGCPEDPIDSLTDRQLEIFDLMGRGRGVGEIAASLNVARATVDSHIAQIKKNLHISTNTELRKKASHWISTNSQNYK